MERAPCADPSLMRVGVSLGGGEGGVGMSDMMSAVNEFMSRMLNIARLMVVIGPVVHQSCYMHSVDFTTWLARLGGIVSCVGVIALFLMPEQVFNGMALKHWRWLFRLAYPEAAAWSGDVLAGGAAAPSAAEERAVLQRAGAGELAGLRVRVRWHGSGKHLGLSKDGYAATVDSSFAVAIRLESVASKGEDTLPDTYKLRIDEPGSRCHGSWLSFSPMNQLRLGGWLGTYGSAQGASPYKVVVDSSCPPGTCKLLCAWPQISPITQRYCTGFYVAEQLHGGRAFVGHAPDVDAAILELLPAGGEEPSAQAAPSVKSALF